MTIMASFVTRPFQHLLAGTQCSRMISEDSIENRHRPPGVNSRSAPAPDAADDLEVLREIEDLYFSDPGQFDARRHVLLHAPASDAGIDELYNKLKRQLQVVNSKALHLISQQREKCDAEFTEIQQICHNVTETLQTCQKAREQLRIAKNNLTLSTFVILANFRKRQVIKTVLKSLQLLKSLQSVEKDVNDLLSKKEYEAPVSLIQKGLKAAASNKEYSCISDLASRLQDTLDITEEKLDLVLASLCYKFDSAVFVKLRRAYDLLGKTQAAMEQLHMHYSSAINETAFEAVKLFVADCSEVKFQDVCQGVPSNKAHICLLNLCEKLFCIMRSYYLLEKWHESEPEIASSNNVFDIERNVSKEYIKQKLKSGLVRIWQDVQSKVSVFLKSSGLEEFPFEKFVLMLGILRKLTLAAEVFCGDKSDVLQEFIKTHSVLYIENYHKGRIEELKLFLENEGWEQCPVKNTFTILNLQEFKPMKKHIKLSTSKLDMSMSKTFSDTTSSIPSQDESVTISKYFDAKSTRTPFEIFHKENITNDDIFGVEFESHSSDSDDEVYDMKDYEYTDDTDRNYSGTGPEKAQESPSKVKSSVIVTNTTLSLLRNCGQYLQICRYLPQISLQVIMLMNQLFDYYIYSVHYIFTSDLEVAASALYTSKLAAVLKRISINIATTDDVASNSSETKFQRPVLPCHLDLKSEESLHGLSERIVAVESVVFLAKQFEILQSYLESIVAQHQIIIVEHFRDNTLAAAADLRMPVYMSSVSKSINASSALVAISQVKWDVKTLATDNSAYVDMLLRKIQLFAMRFENLSSKISLNVEVLRSVWSVMSKFLVHLLVEGYSNSSKCSNAGRGLMQLDYRQLFVKLEKISNLKPIPYQDYVDSYVKAYYLPRNELEEFIRSRVEYSNKHLAALVTCACDNKRDRQDLLSILEGKNI